jgi:cell wall-associated NlpC family hydrolase
MSVVRAAPLVALALVTLSCAEPAYAPYGPVYPYAVVPPPAAYWGLSGPAAAARAVAFAQASIGTPYCWGGSGPRCYDCSGLTRAAWASAGISIPRTSTAQLGALRPVPIEQVQPGDILWRPGHVGIYAGQGWVIAATHRGDVVRYQSASGFQRAVRP